MLHQLKFKDIQVPVIFEENHDLPIFVLRLVFKNAGKAYEGDIDGLASMFARLLNEGSDENFFKELELRAIDFSANSGFESFELSISCLKEHAFFAVEKLSLLFEKVNFDETLLARLKKITLGELASKQSDFDFLAKNLLNESVFETKEFRTSKYGDEQSLAKMSLKDLQDFYAKHLNLSELIVCGGGDFDFAEFKALITPCLSKLKIAKLEKTKTFKLSKSLKDELLIKPESQQAYIYFASPIEFKFNDEDTHLTKLALFILGAGGFGSRLMEEVRVKRGLAYSAYAMLEANLSYQRVFGYLQTKNENAKDAKALVRELFAEFVKNGVSEDELTQARNFLLGSVPLRYESLEKRLDMALNEFYKGLELGHSLKELERIKKTSLSELNAYIKKHTELAQISFASVQNK
ncbi:insulinase family protein [Campylobacter sp. MIT 12-8780]|uniref:M16 family metallopeptidase n=1 Tax=unclassified Campylobacter TaxID=2593542 RepID=UPI00115EDF00|nr:MULTISPECIES: pitrilysin family protein [unclassified Campylobacter]NDJ27563.1 insulinase family protein [Campylobacter sp. MIT 19-121]TQR41315.1 insulinase family protein [Campylobacter sp. MIT 12-8780]